MISLHINIDHVATVRQARQINEPDPVTAAGLVELAGADGITIHLREDRRHIIDRDVRILRETVQTRLNLEMAATAEMFRIALEQDRRVLKSSLENAARFPDAKPLIGPLDYLRRDIEAIEKGDLPGAAASPRTAYIEL